MMPIEDVFSIKGRGTVVTGRMDRGIVKVGDPAEIVGLQEKSLSTVVTGVEMFHKMLDQGMAGDNLGLLLRGIERTDVERGLVIAKPGSITPHKKFLSASVRAEEGRRWTTQGILHRIPSAVLYQHHGRHRQHQVYPKGSRWSCPGDNINLEVELIVPVALEQGSKFAIREGGLTVGAGVITKILD